MKLRVPGFDARDDRIQLKLGSLLVYVDHFMCAKFYFDLTVANIKTRKSMFMGGRILFLYCTFLKFTNIIVSKLVDLIPKNRVG